MMTDSDVIDVRDLPPRLQSLRSTELAQDDAQMTMEQAARAHAQRVLAQVGGNKVRAAEILGISRTYLYDLLKKGAAASDEGSGESETEESKLVMPKSPEHR